MAQHGILPGLRGLRISAAWMVDAMRESDSFMDMSLSGVLLARPEVELDISTFLSLAVALGRRRNGDTPRPSDAPYH